MLPVVCDRLDFELGLTRRKGRWTTDLGAENLKSACQGITLRRGGFCYIIRLAYVSSVHEYLSLCFLLHESNYTFAHTEQNSPSTLLHFSQHRSPVKLSHCLIIMPSSSVYAGEDGHPSSALDSSKYLEPLTETINSQGDMCFTSPWGTKFFWTSYDGAMGRYASVLGASHQGIWFSLCACRMAYAAIKVGQEAVPLCGPGQPFPACTTRTAKVALFAALLAKFYRSDGQCRAHIDGQFRSAIYPSISI